MKRGLLATVLIVALVASATGLVAWRDRQYGDRRTSSDLLYFRSGTALARIALSFDALLADVYWIRAVQHYGGTRLSKDPSKRYHLLQPLLDCFHGNGVGLGVGDPFGKRVDVIRDRVPSKDQGLQHRRSPAPERITDPVTRMGEFADEEIG